MVGRYDSLSPRRMYNLRPPSLLWLKALAASTLGLVLIVYLGHSFQSNSPTIGLLHSEEAEEMPPRSFAVVALAAAVAAQAPMATPASASGWSTTLAGTPTAFRSVFTIPASADQGADLIPNIQDPQAIDAQDICPGYKASQLEKTDSGISAVLTLAGKPCNVYGNDVDVLNLKVEYQSKDRLAVNISPRYLVRHIPYF